jgi:hypothetical protein
LSYLPLIYALSTCRAGRSRPGSTRLFGSS